MKKKVLKIIGIIVLILVIAVAIFLGTYTIKEYRPKDKEDVTVENAGSDSLSLTDTVDIVTMNTGYAGLSADQDCYFDGGETVIPESEDIITRNLKGMAKLLKNQNADIYFLQEVDRDSKRSYYVDELETYSKTLGMSSMYGCNFRCFYVPFNKHMGKVEAGVVTMTNYKVSSSTRISLPSPWKWPMSCVNLKRCILETRIPIDGTDKELVVFNLHLEAYDSGEGKVAQTKMLAKLIEAEYKKGNYVIAGGDFNQTFEPVEDAYPATDETEENDLWMPGYIANSDLPSGFSFAVSDNCATSRCDNRVYDKTVQHYIIDGFIVSDNLTVDYVENIDAGFEYSDHNPVHLQVSFSK